MQTQTTIGLHSATISSCDITNINKEVYDAVLTCDGLTVFHGSALRKHDDDLYGYFHTIDVEEPKVISLGPDAEKLMHLYFFTDNRDIPDGVIKVCRSILIEEGRDKPVLVGGNMCFISHDEYERIKVHLSWRHDGPGFEFTTNVDALHAIQMRVITDSWRAMASKLLPILLRNEEQGSTHFEHKAFVCAAAVMKQVAADMRDDDAIRRLNQLDSFQDMREVLPPLHLKNRIDVEVANPEARRHAVNCIRLLSRYGRRHESFKEVVWARLIDKKWHQFAPSYAEAHRIFLDFYGGIGKDMLFLKGKYESAVAAFDLTKWYEAPRVQAQGGDFVEVTRKAIEKGVDTLFGALAKVIPFKDNPIMARLVIGLILGYIITKLVMKIPAIKARIIILLVAATIARSLNAAKLVPLSEELMDACRDYVHEMAYDQAEAVHEAVRPQSSFTTVGVAFASFFVARKIPFYSKVVNLKKFEDGIRSLAEGSLSSAEGVVNAILRLVGRQEISLINTHNKMLQAWRDASLSFSHKVRLGKITATDPGTCITFEKLRDQGLAYMSEFKGTEHARVVKVGMDSLQLASPFFPATAAARGRMEPVCACLLGEPGVGKTFLSRLVSQLFVTNTCSDEEIKAMGGDLARLVFQKDSSDYWEGYVGQTVCVMDDFLQANPVPGANGEVENFIRMVNQWPFPLNMATLDMKGKFYFKSNFVLTTTNRKNLGFLSKVICSSGAVKRRIGHCYQIHVNDGFSVAGDKLDPRLFNEEGAHDIDVLDRVWSFTPYDLEVGSVAGPPVGLKEFLRLIVVDYRNRLRTEATTNTIVDKLAQYIVPQSFDVRPYVLGGAIALAAPKVVKGVVNGLSGMVRRIVGKKVKQIATSKKALPVYAIASAFLVPGIVIFLKGFKFLCKSVLKPFGIWSSEVKAQGIAPSLDKDEVSDRIRRNTVVVYGHKGDKIGYGLMVTCDSLLVPQHYVMQNGGVEFSLRNGLGVKIGETIRSIRCFRDRDACVLETHRQVDGVADIRTHFGESLNPRFGTNKAIMINVAGYHNTHIEPSIVVRKYDTMRITSQLIKHTARTVIGDCGSAIVSGQKTARNRLLGIHVAGDVYGGCGYFVPISKSDLLSVGAQAHCGFEELEQVQPIFNSGTTAFVPTSYSGAFAPPTGGPAHLRPAVDKDGQRVDPMIKAVMATNRDSSHIVLPGNIDEIVDCVVGEIFSNFTGEDLSQLSYEQAVAGVDGDCYIRGINRSKSMGYPLCRKYHNKRAAFGQEGPYTFHGKAAEEVKAEFNKLVEAYSRSERHKAVFRDVLKDEIRSQKKLDEVDTRLISASPVQYTILTRMVFARFSAAFMRHRTSHGGLIGINPMSHEWGFVYNDLATRNKGGKAAAGDFKFYDKSQLADVLRCILEHVVRRLPPGIIPIHVIQGVIHDTVTAAHLGGDSMWSHLIYVVFGSLPSGHPLTSVLNSIYNMVVFRCAWCNSRVDRTPWNFRDHVSLYVYGDDNIFAPDDDNIDFDLMTMVEYAPKLNMIYTNEDKNEDNYNLKDVSACNLLKRGFAVEPGFVYAPLNKQSIYDMFNWRKSTSTDEGHLEDVSRACLMEMSAHPFVDFLEVLEKLRCLLKANGVRDPTFGVRAETAYAQQRSIYRSNVPVWSFDE